MSATMAAIREIFFLFSFASSSDIVENLWEWASEMVTDFVDVSAGNHIIFLAAENGSTQ
jgi:hypothetical protein